MKSIIRTTLIGGWVAVFATASVFAQQNDNRKPDRTDQATDGSQNQLETDARKDQADRSPHDHLQKRSDQKGRRILVDPLGWVTVYTDYDNDGRIDGKETLYFLDLLQARGESQTRRATEQRNRTARTRGRSPYPRQKQTDQVQGKIKDQAEFELRGHEEKFLVAKIDTEDDRIVRVVLGTRDDLKELNLTEGNIVTVKGDRHWINNKPVLFARTVSAQGKTVNVTPAKSQNEQRARGTIESLEKRTFRHRDGEFVVAKVDLVSGRTRTVILGPSDQLKSLNLKEGDEVSVMARNGRLNNRAVLVASEIRAKDRTVSIPYAKLKSHDRSKETRREQTTLKPKTEDATERKILIDREDTIERKDATQREDPIEREEGIDREDAIDR